MKAKTKKILTGTAAIVLTAAISAGGTFAFLTKLTEKRANNFTFSDGGMDAMLTEDKWDGIDGYEYDENGTPHPHYHYKDKNGNEKKTWGRVKTSDNPEDWEDVNYTPEELDSFYVDGTDENDKFPPDVPQKVKEWIRNNKQKDKNWTPKWSDYTTPDRSDPETPFGYQIAEEMVPGAVAPKNPQITNTGDSDEWVAAKVTFVYASDEGVQTDGLTKTEAGKPLSTADFAAVQDVIRIDWAGTGDIDEWGNGLTAYGTTPADTTTPSKKWYMRTLEGGTTSLTPSNYDSSMVFYYDTLLTADGAETTPIFYNVGVDPDADSEDIQKLIDMGGFSIYIEGYASQAGEFASGIKWVKEGSATFGSGPQGVFYNTFTADVTFPGITGKGLTEKEAQAKKAYDNN